MPSPTLPTPPVGGLTITLTVQRLKAAHATVWPLPASPGAVAVQLGTVDQRVELLDDLPVVRGLLTDALAQLDAIEAGQ
jgi:hypothetical protein